MITNSKEHPYVRFSVWIYQALLLAYPDRFKREYGTQMVQVFRDGCVQSVRNKSVSGMIYFWILTMLDFLFSVIKEHSQKEAEMTKSTLIRYSGWVLIVGAILFLLPMVRASTSYSIWGYMADSYIPQPGDIALIIGGFVAPILIAIGLLGIWARFGESTGIGRHILMTGITVGVTIFCVIGFIQFVTPSNTIVRPAHSYIILGGIWFMFFCLAVFGIFIIKRKPMQKWNGAALAAGGAWVAVSPILAWMFSLHSLSQNPIPFVVMLFAYIVSTIALILLGLNLQSSLEHEPISSMDVS